METEKIKSLPKGVGKRIIETLKSQELQTEYDETVVPEIDEQEDIEPVDNIEEEQVYSEEPETNFTETDFEKQPIQDSKKFEETSDINYSYSEKTYQTNESFNTEPQEKNNVEISDIDTLLNLIDQLPSGVTKQTGAFIIRQTMEAMGISMNKVLSNAQSIQEELEHGVRNNVNVIEEYRTKIKLLEQEIQKFRKKSHELEDIISLFILSENNK